MRLWSVSNPYGREIIIVRAETEEQAVDLLKDSADCYRWIRRDLLLQHCREFGTISDAPGVVGSITFTS